MSKPKLLVAAALALSGVLSAGVAHAGNPDVQWSVTIGSSVGVPVVHQPVVSQPVVSQPVVVTRPVVVQQPVYAQPVYVSRPRWHGYSHPTRWDVDGDGIPNRRDAVYNPRWDRDGDGIPTRHDRYDNRRYIHEGAPQWQERRGGRYGQ